MTGREFKNIRISSLKVTREQLATMMDTPLSTIRDLETLFADKEIRGCYARLLQLLVERDTWVMARVKAKVEAAVDRDFPRGIPSEVDDDDCDRELRNRSNERGEQ